MRWLWLLGWVVCWTGVAAPAAAPVPAAGRFPPETTEAEVREWLGKAPMARPRLLVTAAELRALPGRAASDPWLRTMAGMVRRDADAMLALPPAERRLEGRRLLGESRRVLGRVLTLAMAFHLSGERQYVVRAEREMRAAAGFSDWNPGHFLDVGEMTLALAIGYDWLYDVLEADARATIGGAILAKGVRVPLDTAHNAWTRASNNWGQVCHAGMVAGALAVLEEDREAAVLTVQRAVANVPRSMAVFAPNGSYPEGPGYWSYGTTFNVLLIGMLESAVGTCFGLDRAPGFDRTGGYLAMVTGPSGLTFNYADGGSGRGVEPAVHWLARRYGRPEWMAGEARALERVMQRDADGGARAGRLFPLMLLWGQDPAKDSATGMPLHWTSGDRMPIAVHRGSWTDTNAIFVGLKAGSPSGPHGHMDVGSFVLDAGGVRWAMDLGAEGYHRIESRGMNFWSMVQDSQRWAVFRQNNFSHNTLVIDGALQRAAGDAPVVRFSADATFPHSVVDMSAVYAGQAKTAHRGVGMLAGGSVLVRDRLTGLKAGARVRWGMVTPATPGRVGGRTLDLRQQAKTLGLRIVEPADGAWTLYDTAVPKQEWDSPNPGTIMVGFEAVAPDSGTLDLTVVMAPGRGGAGELSAAQRRDPLEWSAPLR